jgi:hypothetical protein
VLLLCTSNYSGSRIIRACARRRPTRRCAGAGAGAARTLVGTMTLHGASRSACRVLRDGHRAAVRLELPRRLGVVPRWRARARSCSPTPSTTRRSPTAAAGRAECFAYDHATWSTALGLRQPTARALIVTDGVFGMTATVGVAREIVRTRPRFDVRVMVDEAHGLGCRGQLRPAVASLSSRPRVDCVGSLGTPSLLRGFVDMRPRAIAQQTS